MCYFALLIVLCVVISLMFSLDWFIFVVGLVLVVGLSCYWCFFYLGAWFGCCVSDWFVLLAVACFGVLAVLLFALGFLCVIACVWLVWGMFVRFV